MISKERNRIYQSPFDELTWYAWIEADQGNIIDHHFGIKLFIEFALNMNRLSEFNRSIQKYISEQTACR